MSISTYRRYRRGRALPISGLDPIPHEAPHPPHAGPRGQRAADHRAPCSPRRSPPACTPIRSSSASASSCSSPRCMAMVLVNGWLLRRRFAPLEELIDAMERVDFGGRDPRAAIADGQRRGGRAPAPRLRPHARAPGGRALPHGHRGAARPRRASAPAWPATCTTRPTRRSRACCCAWRRPPRTLRPTCAPSCARRRASPRRRWASSCAWPASCVPSPSTTSASAPPCARRSTSSAGAPA